jgi:hypothetical protein
LFVALLASGCALGFGLNGLTGGSQPDAGPPEGGSGVLEAGDANPTGDERSEAFPDTGGDEGAVVPGDDASSAPEGAGPESGPREAAASEAATPDAATSTTDSNPTKDAYVEDATQAGTNFGTDTHLIVKTKPTAGLNRNTWITFDISGYSSVTAARLRLYVVSLDGANSNAVPVVLSYAPTASDGWNEHTITWNTAPAAGAVFGMTTVSDAMIGAWIEVDVTAPVQGDTDGLATFVATSTPATNRGVTFSSRDGASPPVLRITGTRR